MFASGVKLDVEVGDGITVVIRKLSAAKLQNARDAKQVVAAQTLRSFGGDVLKAIRSDKSEPVALTPEAAAAAKYTPYDHQSVLRSGIESWSHERALTQEAIEDLDEARAELLVRAIIDLSVPDAVVAAAATSKG